MYPDLHYISTVSSRHNLKGVFVCCFLMMFFASSVAGQKSGTLDPVYDDARLDQKLGESIPLDLDFVDENGQPVSLQSYFDGEKPVMLTLAYFNCPSLCNLLLKGATEAMAEMALTAGQEFEMITLSIAPDDTPEAATEKKALYLEQLGKSEAEDGWHFLTGEEADIQKLADAIGFRYKWVEEIEQYVHPPIITLLTPDGTVSRYLQGITFEARELRLALIEASEGGIGSPIDLIALYCLQYDPETNGYVANAANLMKLGGGLTVLLLALGLFILWRREGQPAQANS